MPMNGNPFHNSHGLHAHPKHLFHQIQDILWETKPIISVLARPFALVAGISRRVGEIVQGSVDRGHVVLSGGHIARWSGAELWGAS